MKEHNIAAQLYTVRDFLKTPEDVAATLKRVRAIGYQAVQVSGMGPIGPARIKAICDDLSLSICATHVGFGELQNGLDEVVRTHKLWGCHYVGLGSIPEAYRSSQQGYRTFIEEFSEIGRRLESHGLHLVYHNHNFEFEKFDGITGMELLLEGASSDTYTLELDVYWVQAGGGNPTDWIRSANERIKVIHLKDMAVVNGQPVFAEIGEGNLAWDSILRACRQSGVEWYAVEQDTCQRDPFESLAMSFRYLQSKTATHEGDERMGDGEI